RPDQIKDRQPLRMRRHLQQLARPRQFFGAHTHAQKRLVRGFHRSGCKDIYIFLYNNMIAGVLGVPPSMLPKCGSPAAVGPTAASPRPSSRSSAGARPVGFPLMSLTRCAMPNDGYPPNMSSRPDELGLM